MDFIQERSKPETVQCSFYADIGTSANPQDSFSFALLVVTLGMDRK